MTDDTKDNVVDFKSRKSKDGGSDNSDGGGSDRRLYYAVQPVISVEEGERLIRLKYMTESGYLDILGIMNQVQVHNRAKFYTQGLVGSLAILLSIISIGMSAYAIWR